MPLNELIACANHPLEIVVVEDHDLLRDELVDFLNRPGIQVRGAEDGEALDAALRQRPADILVVDLNLPGEDGLSICQRMRRAFPDMGLVMLTARMLPSDKAAGYQSGADVYLTKPANVDELEAVIANLSRRLRRRDAPGLRLDMARQLLALTDGVAVRLTLQEAQLLYELALAPERKLSTEALLQRLAPHLPSDLAKDKLPVTISRLRQKMSEGLDTADLIKAVRGFGYQLTQSIAVLG